MFQSLGVVLVERNAMPKRRWLVRPFDGLHTQVGRPCEHEQRAKDDNVKAEFLTFNCCCRTSFFNHSCVTTVCEGTRAPIAQTGDTVLIPAERVSACLHLVATVSMINYLSHKAR